MSVPLFNSVEDEYFERFDILVLDIWGVLHQSWKVYESTINSLNHLQKLNKTVLLLTNAPHRSSAIISMLKDIGIIYGIHYQGIMTSGEQFVLDLEKYNVKKALLYSSGNGQNYLNNIDISVIAPEDYEKYDYEIAIFSGVDEKRFLARDGKTAEEILEIESETEFRVLRYFLKKDIPIFCINPDRFVNSQNGQLVPCAGYYAEEYTKMGGKVIYVGKPYPEIMETLFLHTIKKDLHDCDKSKIVMIGDNVETDIKIAELSGITGCLCLSGLFQENSTSSLTKVERDNLDKRLNQTDAKIDCAIMHL